MHIVSDPASEPLAVKQKLKVLDNKPQNKKEVQRGKRDCRNKMTLILCKPIWFADYRYKATTTDTPHIKVGDADASESPQKRWSGVSEVVEITSHAVRVKGNVGAIWHCLVGVPGCALFVFFLRGAWKS